MWSFSTAESVAEVPCIPAMIAAGIERHPERTFVSFKDGSEWTWAEAQAQARSGAALLETHGVKQGSRVILFLGNSAEFLKIWWGCSYLGAVVAPLNTAYRGRILGDLIRKAEPALIVADAERALRLDEIDLEVPRLPFADILPATGNQATDYQYRPSDPHAIIFTSGTTGASKGSVSAFPQLFAAGSWLIDAAQLTSEDVFLVDMPLFHFSGLAPLLAIMNVKGRLAVRAQPSMSSYWQTGAEAGATFSVVAGTMVEFLMMQPPAIEDRNHCFRVMLSAPLPSNVDSFCQRFGLDGLISAYGSGETNLVVNQRLDFPVRAKSCGKLREGFELRLVDEYDLPVPDGSIGEAVVRSKAPWVLSTEYYGEPEATAKAWRNGWFHTGDLLSCDADGYYYFHDRSKDSLRRRGENISSMEVEREVLSYRGIVEAACVPFPSEVPGDDDVKVFIVVESNVEVNYTDLLSYLSGKMPHFMVPRYFEPIDAFPKTATHRVKKQELRALGNSERTWDSAKAGLKITRNGIVRI